MSSEDSRGTSRSEFLKRAAGTTMVVAGAGVGAGAFAQQAAASSVPTGRFAVEIGGLPCGFLGGATGGGRDYEVALDPVGQDGIQRKHLGQPKYEDFTIQVGSNMDSAMYDWIKDSFDGKHSRRNGAIIAADFDYNEKSRREFTNALITEVSIPALDAASKDHAYISVRISTASVADVKGSGAKVVGPRQKAFLPSNFRFIVKGVDTTRVASLERHNRPLAFSWSFRTPADGSPPVTDVGDLGVSFPAASLPSWQRWFDNFAVGGDATDERNGALELVGENGAVLNIGLFNLGLYNLDPNNGAGLRRVKAEMYCERASWDLAKGK